MLIHNKRGQKKDPHRIDLKFGELKYEGVDDSLTAVAGLPVMLELFYRSRQFANFVKNLPGRTSHNTYGTERIALLIWLGFLRGFDCMEDLADFEWDAGVMQKFGEIPTPRSIGNYLRDLSPENCEGLNEFLRTMAVDARQRLCPDLPLIIDVDSTSHVQRGSPIEGLATLSERSSQSCPLLKWKEERKKRGVFSEQIQLFVNKRLFMPIWSEEFNSR